MLDNVIDKDDMESNTFYRDGEEDENPFKNDDNGSEMFYG
jgi:hypothetical protein